MQSLVKESDPIRQMKEIIQELNEIENPSTSDVEKVEILYEKLTNLVCDIDLALDFCKLDGLSLVDKYLKSDSEEIRVLFISLVSIIAQDNVEVQHRLFETDLLDRFLNIIRDSTNSTVGFWHLLGCVIRFFRRQNSKLLVQFRLLFAVIMEYLSMSVALLKIRFLFKNSFVLSKFDC